MAKGPSTSEIIGRIKTEGPAMLSGIGKLAGAEIKPAAKHGGIGTGLFAVAAKFGLSAVTYFALAVGFLFSWLWAKTGVSVFMALFLGFLSLGVAALIATGVFAILGAGQFKQVHGPEATIAEVKASVASISQAAAAGSTAATRPAISATIAETPPAAKPHVVRDSVYTLRRKLAARADAAKAA
jgi:hypothetical protein